MNYNMMQEGVVALVLSLYSRESNSFTEIALYSLIENQATILKIIEPGVYVLSIQPVASSREKFSYLGKTKISSSQTCFTADYTYLIDTMSLTDKTNSGAVDLVLNLFGIPNMHRLQQ